MIRYFEIRYKSTNFVGTLDEVSVEGMAYCHFGVSIKGRLLVSIIKHVCYIMKSMVGIIHPAFNDGKPSHGKGVRGFLSIVSDKSRVT
jgi:hypothetical protein